jgi:hypothetical protein
VANKAPQVPLFLHLPKTGGSTLRNCVFKQYRTDKYYEADRGYFVCGVYYYPAGLLAQPGPELPARVRRTLARADVRAVIGHFSFGIHRFMNVPTTEVTIVREPVDRVISLFYHLRKYDQTVWHRPIVTRNLSVEDFIRDLSCREADNGQTRRIAGRQPRYGACSAAMLERAKTNLRRYFSVVGTTDRFDETLLLIKRKLGWVDPPFYRPALVNTDRPPTTVLPQSTRDVISERNQYDVQLYEFAGELLEESISREDATFRSDLQQFRVWNSDYIASRTQPGA